MMYMNVICFKAHMFSDMMYWRDMLSRSLTNSAPIPPTRIKVFKGWFSIPLIFRVPVVYKHICVLCFCVNHKTTRPLPGLKSAWELQLISLTFSRHLRRYLIAFGRCSRHSSRDDATHSRRQHPSLWCNCRFICITATCIVFDIIIINGCLLWDCC